MEWVIALLLTLNFSLVISLFWFWKWSIQRMQELETSVVRLKYQEGVPPLQPEIFLDLKKRLDALQQELTALQDFQKDALPLLEQIKNEPKFEEAEQEREIKRALSVLGKESALSNETHPSLPTTPLKTLFASA